MKRLPSVLLAAAFLFLAPSASAQTTLALQGGLNLSVLSNEFEDSIVPVNYLRIVQPTFGLSATFQLSPPESRSSLGGQLSATYIPKGADLQGRSTGGIRLNYVELGALFDARVPLSSESLAIHILAGPAMGWLMSCERGGASCGEDEFNTLDFGLSFGASLEAGLTDRVAVTGGFLYNAAFSYADARDDPALKNRSVALRAGFLFPLG